MKRSLLLALAAVFAACNPDVPTGTDNSSKFVVAEFDPANGVIPLPNDLVFLDANGNLDTRLHAPETGGTPAQNEFNRDYLNHLDGFPMESAASVLFDKAIDPTSIVLYDGTNAAGPNMAIFDITGNVPVTAASFSVSPAPNNGQTLNIAPKGGYWTRGHQYAVLILGGANGIKGAQSGQTVTGSPTWGLVVSSQPLVVCDSNGQNCRPATTAIPTTERDPATAFAQQLATAKQLEQLRKNYSIILGPATALIPGLKATDIAIVWTFTITSQAEVTFDLANSIIPFPNDVLNPTGSQVTLPVPPDAGALTDLYTGLNTLDGFSTTAPIISENGDGTGPLIQGRIGLSSLVLGGTGSINIVQAAAGKGAHSTTADGSIKAHVCLNCPPIAMLNPDGGAILLPDGGVKPDTLAIVPDVPLTEKTQYAVYMTTDIRDTTNTNVIASPAFALVRSSSPLFDGTHSTVSLLTDAQAAEIEPLRSGLRPLFDNLAASGLPRTKVALAWAFTTQSTVTTLTQLHGAPFAGPVPDLPLWIQAIPPPGGVPANNVGTWYVGEMLDVFALTDPRGVLNADTTKWTAPKLSFVMTVPDPATRAQPTNGYPVTIFGHGLGGNRTNAFAIAASLASATPGQVTIAVDETWHGDRNTCTGFGAFLLQAGVPAPIAQDLYACVNPAPPGTPTQTCNETTGRCELGNRNDGSLVACNHTLPDADKGCLLAGQGRCSPDDKCEGGAFAASFSPGGGVNIPVNGWKLINLLNFFASRDNLRQQVITDAQVARVVSSATTGNLGQQAGIKLDPTKISYAGQSLGGIMGTLYSAVAPEVRNAALNVPGGDVPGIIFTSPAFTQLKTGFDQGLAAQGIPINSPTYDFFVGTITRWIIDPADPSNLGPYLVRDTGLSGALANQGSTRRGFVQWVLNDQVVPNPNTLDLIHAIVGDPTANGVLMTPSPGGLNFWAKQWTSVANHGFLLTGPDAAAAQAEIANFVSGNAPF